MKSRTTKIFISIECVLMILAIMLTTAFIICPQDNQEITNIPAGGVMDENGNEMISGTVYPMSTNMLFTSPSAMSTTASEGVTLQATVKPDDAINKAVDWSVSFVNSSSSWATGKTITDYVTVTPTSDGATTATVTCAQAFGEKIRITVTLRNNPEAKDSCIVDYARRIEGFGMSVSSLPGKADGFAVPSNATSPSVMPVYMGEGDLVRDITFTAMWGVGTVNDTFSQPSTISVSLSDAFLTAAEEAGLEWGNDSTAELPVSSGLFSGDNVLSYFTYDGESFANQPLEMKNKLFRALNASASAGVVEITAVMKGTYSGDITGKFVLSLSEIAISAESVTLDKTTIVL